MTKLDAAHVLPIQTDSTSEAYMRQKVLPVPCAEFGASTVPEATSKASFEGRWLVVTDLGDCIIDHVVSGCSEDIRKVHVKTVCALVASVSQFVVDICNQKQAIGSMHALALSTFKVLVFRCSGFSVAAVLRKSSSLETAAQYKAQEIGIALKEKIGEALATVVKQLEAKNDVAMHSFTLESMLDSAGDGQNKVLLDPGSQSISEAVFQEKLSMSYGDMLRGVIGEPQDPSCRNVCQACVCDHRGRLLTLLRKADQYSGEHFTWDSGSKFLYSTAQKLTSLASSSPAEDTIFSTESSYATGNVLSKLDADDQGLLSLWFWEENGSTTLIVVGIAGPLRICIQFEDSQTELLPTRGNPVLLSSLSLKISQILCEEQPLLSLRLLGDLSNILYSLSMALGNPRQKPTLFVQHAAAQLP